MSLYSHKYIDNQILRFFQIFSFQIVSFILLCHFVGFLETSSQLSEVPRKIKFKCTKTTKLIIFQYKLLHRRLSTNSFLKKIGIRQSDLCTFCKTEAESLIHLFWSCRVTSLFWQELKQWIATNHETAINDLRSATVLGLKPYAFNKKICGHFLLARYYIWISRTQEKTLSLDNFLILQHSFVTR